MPVKTEWDRAARAFLIVTNFKVLKGRKLVFVNPCARMSAPHERKITPGVDLQRLRDNLTSRDPATAALAALLAFHAVRLKQLRAMLLTDVRDGRLHVGEQVIVLAEPGAEEDPCGN
jgi:hypothetical protein